jgi:hypothetical protein
MIGATVYRCETNGKVNNSDAPRLGAEVIDVTPTQGVDKMACRSSKGKEVQREEFHRTLDTVTRPLHGLSHYEMELRRRRYKLSSTDQFEAPRWAAAATAGRTSLEDRRSDQGQADVALYQVRRRAFDLKC